MLIKEIASLAEVGVRTIQRDISKFNELNETDHSESEKYDHTDVDLLTFIANKRGIEIPITYPSSKNIYFGGSERPPSDMFVEKNTVNGQIDILEQQNQVNELFERANRPSLSNDNGDKRVSVPDNTGKGRQKSNSKPKTKKKTDLQTRLSADWLVLTVLAIILLMDVFVFGAIGQHEFGEKVPMSWMFFGVIGFATGIGSISTYNRIEKIRVAETWKYIFSVMQLLVFMLTMNEVWFWAEVVMSLMVVTVFTGTQRAIKN